MNCPLETCILYADHFHYFCIVKTKYVHPLLNLKMNTITDNLEKRMMNNGVRPSPVRNLVLRTLDNATSPLSAHDIENELQTVDRSSITRTIAIFLNAGLIHAIPDGTAAVKYESCHSDNRHKHDDEHPHFHCEICGRTICLAESHIPQIGLPDGFTALKSNFVIFGICDQCRSTKE